MESKEQILKELEKEFRDLPEELDEAAIYFAILAYGATKLGWTIAMPRTVEEDKESLDYCICGEESVVDDILSKLETFEEEESGVVEYTQIE